MATAKQNETFADTLATVLHQDAEHTVYRLGGADGEVVQTVYPVFPGIEIVYHDVHATACAMQRTRAPGCLEIHHCREGRIEQPVAGGAYSYVASGDLKIDDRSRHTGMFVLPLGHYRGITVSFDLARAERSIAQALGGFPVDLRALRDRFCRGGDPFIMHDAPGAEHIF